MRLVLRDSRRERERERRRRLNLTFLVRKERETK